MHSRKMKEPETDEKLLALQYRFLLLGARFLIRNSLCLCVCVCVFAPIAVEIVCVCVRVSQLWKKGLFDEGLLA